MTVALDLALENGSALAGMATADSGPNGLAAVPPRPATDLHPQPIRSRVLVVGEQRRALRVRRDLEGERPGADDVVSVVSAGEAARWLAAERVEVVVLVAPLRGTTLRHALSQLRDAQPPDSDTSYLALVPDGYELERVRGLYDRGARAVLAWPEDLGVLAELVESTLEESPSDAASEDPLERVVRERLQVRLRRFAKGLGVETRRGVARLTGRVSSLWAARALGRQAAASPGIESVDIEGLEVDAPAREDAAIAREIRAILDGSAMVDSSTLGVTVHDGRVVLLGSVLDAERDHVLELVSMVAGVKSVSDRSSSSPRAKRRSRTRARRLQAGLASRGLAAGLRVAVVGPMAVLRGVGSAAEIREAREWLQRWARASGDVRKVLHRAVPRLQASPDASRCARPSPPDQPSS